MELDRLTLIGPRKRVKPKEYKFLGQSVYGQELQTISNMVSKEIR
jgi:hypothetical protein